MTNQSLRNLIDEKINGRWSRWAQKHPNLAEAIDRTRLVESAVKLLREDPEYIAAMHESDLDDAQLTAAARVLERAEHIIGLTLPLL